MQNPMTFENRTGSYTTFGSVRCFDPKPLPPEPPIELSGRLSVILSAADRALARLDGAALTLPDPDLFVYAFMRQEAVLSSQIEGTQASLEDLFEYEAAAAEMPQAESDIVEVINYLNAMSWALEEISKRPISLNLIKGAHKKLLHQGRGAARGPGEFRKNQNWIGPTGCAIEDASFVPPAAPLMDAALSDLERFIHEPAELPPLIRCGLIHAQFETIHPFWDGNGRLGRMLVTLLLCSEEILSKPILYLSLFFKAHKQEYYERLQATRDHGDLEQWLIFFLRGITVTSKSALQAAQRINLLREECLRLVPELSKSNKAMMLLDILFRHPYITVPQVTKRLATSYPTSNKMVSDFVRGNILEEITSAKRGRIFAFRPYLDVLHDSIDDLTGVLESEDYLVTQSG